MAIWRIRHRLHDGELMHTFEPENLRFALNLDQPHDISYQISLDNPIIQETNTAENDPFGAYQTDWELTRDGVIMREMAGMVTSIHIPEGEEYVELTGKSWLHYLDRRHYPYSTADPQPILFRAFQTDMKFVIRDIINTVCARPYSLDIDTSFLDSMDPTFDENVEIAFGDTETILSKISSWAEGKPGFDFAITENKRFIMYYPEVNDPNFSIWTLTAGVPPALNTSSSLIDRGLDWTDNGPAGTHIVGTGAGLSYQLGAARGSIDGQQVFRRLDFTEDFGSVGNRAKLERLTDGALRAAVRPQREVPIKVAPEDIPGFWDVFFPGEYFVAVVPLEAHTVTGTKKITSIECNVSNEGEEDVDIHSTLWRAWYDVDSVENQM